ncbi:chorismate lyase [Proteus mirabilis]|uniref:chorismate lyase n=1 Tax=Proteus mirabilis TaxID=584 RepID=UPI001FACF0C6|nr:chorismate lyase [Proteus mirabilis]MCI9743450.1 chorismate lyase [Proteus mirabilis]MCI9801213.1 chorismate lyase [Proteus mirabilis]MCI9812770.1 chorismate lyase [Proteus mirabilis]
MFKKSIITHAPIHWLSDEEREEVAENTLSWLLELGSMTRRFEQHCHQVTVMPYQEGFIEYIEPADEQKCLPYSRRYWLREIVLCGDNVPWLLGRTLVPEETLTGEDRQLVNLRTVPLGRYLFQEATLSRDFIHIGQQNGHWLRRSRFQLSDKPLLLTEVFLPASPVYKQ